MKDRIVMQHPTATQGLHRATITAMAVAMVWLAGCASRTPFVEPELIKPSAWSGQPVAPSVAASTPQDPAKEGAQEALPTASSWWRSLNDPLLDQFITQAWARNGNLAQAAIKVKRAQLVAGQADSAEWPTVSVKGSSTATRPLDGGATVRQHAVTGSVSWEADLWGRLAAASDAAHWEAQATEQDRQAAALSLSATVANLYWQVAYLNQRVVASQQSQDYSAQTLKLVQAQYEAGEVSGLEVAQATQGLAAQKAAHTQWLSQREQARHALAILLDGPPQAALSEAQGLPDGALPSVQAGLPASLLTRRPDLRAAQWRLQKVLANVDATRGSYFPSLTLTGSVGGSSAQLTDVLRDPVGTLGAGLVLPFVQWRDMQRAVAVSELDYDMAVLAYRQTWYQALAEVENALSARVQYEDQSVHLRQALQAAQAAERLSEARYRAGAVPLKTWLDAQETRRQAENNLAQNRLNRLQAWATLHQALGG